MKIFLLIILATGLVSTEKLDRTYLPPPGSKFSGGSPGDIQVPFEYPKETYLTGQSQPEGIPELELGINRRPKPVVNAQVSTQRPGFTPFRNSYPQTTTSYGITQTTTFAPLDDYDGLGQGSGFSNATGAEQTGLSNYPQGKNYREQPNQRHHSITQNYNQKQPSSLAPYGSTTQRPVFASNRKPELYLPPVFNKDQTTTAQIVFGQNNLGYPFGQPQGAEYQDGQRFSTTYRPLVNQAVITLPTKQQNQFINNMNILSSTASPQYHDERFGPTNIPNVNQQRFGSTKPQQNLNQFPGSPAFATSTVGPQYQDQTKGSLEQNQYFQNQNIPSTVAPQYQNGHRTTHKYITSTTPSHYQDSQKISMPGLGQHRYQQNVSSSTTGPQYQNGQQFTTPGAVPNSQYLGNQEVSSTVASEYQGSQQFSKSGIPLETISSNRQVFGSRLPNNQNQKNPERKKIASSFQNGQQFVTSGADKPIQIVGNQNVPSTTAPQNQNGQRVLRPGTSRNMIASKQGVFGYQVPSTQQNQNQHIGNGNFPSTSAAPQFTDSAQFTTPVSIQQRPVQQNQYHSQGQKKYTSSTAAPEYEIPQYQFTSPESVQRNQYVQGSSQFQNEPQFSTPGVQVGYDSGLPDQQGSGPSGNQQFPSAPLYQSTFAPTPDSKPPGLTDANQYPAQNNYDRFPSSKISPQQFVTEKSPQYNNRGQNVPETTAYEQGAGLQEYGTSTSPDYKGADQTKFSPLPTGNNNAAAVSGFVGQDRPERPQAAFDRTAEILNYENVLTPEGYSYSYDTSNGIHADETGVVGNGTRAQGGYSYTGDDGKIYSVFYSADENGFQPRGEHLPTPPPIPEAIQRVIEQANKDKESGIFDDGSYNEEKYGHEKYNVNRNQLKLKKIKSSINGADLPNRYENKVSTQNKKQFTPIGEKQAYRDDETMDNNEQDHFGNENLDGDEDNIKEKEVNNERVPNMRPTKVKNLTGEDNRRKYENKSNFNQSPQVNKDQVRDIAEGVSMTNISADDDDLGESQDLHDEIDLIDYDPNSRTDFHGTNKYLPKPTAGNKFEQSKRIRPKVPHDNVKIIAKEVSKSGRPSNRKNESSQNVAFEYGQDFNGDERVRKPFGKNKITQKVKQQSKLGQQVTLDNGDVLNSYNVNIGEDYSSGDDKKSPKDSQPNKERNQYGNRRINKPVKPKNGGLEKKYHVENVHSIVDEENGYEYTSPQNKFNSGETVEFPTLTSTAEKLKHISQKGIQTTHRPFMTPKVYGDDNDELTDDDMAGIAHGKPLSPSQKEIYHGFRKGGNKYSYNVSPNETEREMFGENMKTIGEYGVTPSRLSPKIQSTSRPQYEKQDNIQLTRIESSRRPGNKTVFSDNATNLGVSTEIDAFISTTPLPPLISNGNNEYQPQYQISNKPNDDSSRVYEKNTQLKDVRRPGTNDGFRKNPQGQLPSTYRPDNVFGDRTLAPTGTVTVDELGPPISSTAPDVNVKLASKQPGRIEETFRPTVGRFGVTIPTQATSGVYQGSTSAPGEDFSGPKQPQRFNPESGYYY